MRRIVLAAAVLVPLLAPAVDAQVFNPRVRIGRPGPTDPQPLPPAIAPVERKLAYYRTRLAVESYPMVAHFRASEGGPAGSWTSVASGARGEYRFTPNVSATLDAATTLFGGPVDASSLELGTRFHPRRIEGRVQPYVDARALYVNMQSRGPQGFAVGASSSSFWTVSEGVGAAVGAGMDVNLRGAFYLTSGASVLHSRMRTEDLRGGTGRGDLSYSLTGMRWMVGLRYNPMRIQTVPDPDRR